MFTRILFIARSNSNNYHVRLKTRMKLTSRLTDHYKWFPSSGLLISNRPMWCKGGAVAHGTAGVYMHISQESWRVTAACNYSEETRKCFGLSGVKCGASLKEKRQRPPRLEWTARVCTANKRLNYTLLNGRTGWNGERARRWSIFEGGCARGRKRKAPWIKHILPAGMSRSLSTHPFVPHSLYIFFFFSAPSFFTRPFSH